MAVALAFLCDGHVHGMVENGGFVSLRLAAFWIRLCFACRFQVFLYPPVQLANLEDAQFATKLTHDFGVFGGMRHIEQWVAARGQWVILMNTHAESVQYHSLG